MHYLCTKAAIKDIRTSVAEMAEVVYSMTERIKVDLQGDQLAYAVSIFDLKAWRDKNERHLIKPLIKPFLKALKLDVASLVKDFPATAKLLSQLVQAAQAGGKNPSNRVAWSWILIPAWRARFMPPPSFNLLNLRAMEDLVCFYLSLKVNTTTLERNLGCLCRQLAAHSGPHAADGSTLSDVLHVALDGPRQESGLFESVHLHGQHKLVPTEFGRSCGKLWLRCFGRRFHYKYQDKDASTSVRKKARKKPLGTFAAVQRGHREAIKRLSRKAGEDGAGESKIHSFVSGLDLDDFASQPSTASMAGTRWSASSVQATSGDKSTRKKSAAFLFHEHTERKRARSSPVLCFFLN